MSSNRLLFRTTSNENLFTITIRNDPPCIPRQKCTYKIHVPTHAIQPNLQLPIK